MKIALISCSKNKKTIACQAQEMYSESILFKKALAYCKRHDYDSIFILSAKYGVLNLTDEIVPYDQALHSFSALEVRSWAAQCFDTLYELRLIESQFDFYAGKIYYKALASLLPQTHNVLNGLGIGDRLRFLGN